MFVNQLFEHLVCLKAAVLMFAISGVGATLPRHLAGQQQQCRIPHEDFDF
jgi:hypothetical protein